jgi:geranylgeranyl pyrophosphate synthase
MAILAGDAMLTLAYDSLWRAEGPDDVLRVGLVRELGEGTRAMIAGQVYDTLGGMPGGLDDRARLELIHRNKTGALIRAAARMGAMLGGAGAGSAELAAITRFAEDLGLIFQIVDDLLDVTATPEEMGKATGKDASAGKLTYPMVLGVAGTRREITRVQADAEAAMASFGSRATPLVELSRAMAARDR